MFLFPRDACFARVSYFFALSHARVEQVVGRSDSPQIPFRFISQRGTEGVCSRGERVAPPRKGSILGDGAAHLAASCSARGQVGPLPMRGSANLAPPAPPAKRSEPIASQILHLGPPTSEAKIGPAGTSGTGRALQIGYQALMVRWISLTSAWLGAAKAKVPRRISRSAFRVRRGPICCRGVRSRVATEAC